MGAVGSAGSFLDGGCSRPMQRAAIDLLNRDIADAEANGIQAIFKKKRQRMLDGLGELGENIARIISVKSPKHLSIAESFIL